MNDPLCITHKEKTYLFIQESDNRVTVYRVLQVFNEAKLQLIDEWARLDGWATPKEFRKFCKKIAKEHPRPCS